MLSGNNLISHGAALACALLLTGMTLILSDTLLNYPQGGAHLASPSFAGDVETDPCRPDPGEAERPLPCTSPPSHKA